ncbi:MAG: hypothetical protein JW757_05150 [Anaerolineales bacterium]|nr:hypothetical protein [Anaerolineales bacterium]
MAQNRDYRGRSVVWPLILISLGVVFLLNNLGIISWDIWYTLVQMWPVLLVAIGIDLIIGRRSNIFSVISALIIIGLFAGAFWLIGVTGDAWSGEQVSRSILQQAEGAQAAEIEISMSVGELLIEALPDDANLLIDGEIRVSEYETVAEKLRMVGDTAVYSLETHGQQYHPGWIFSDRGESNKYWDLAINPNLPLELRLDSGVGRSEIDLSGMTLEYLEIDSGVGEVVVTLPEDGDYVVRVSGGVGRLEIRLPANVAARISLDTGLGDITILGDFYLQDGDYYSEGYSRSDQRVEIHLDGGVGNIKVVQIAD